MTTWPIELLQYGEPRASRFLLALSSFASISYIPVLLLLLYFHYTGYTSSSKHNKDTARLIRQRVPPDGRFRRSGPDLLASSTRRRIDVRIYQYFASSLIGCQTTISPWSSVTSSSVSHSVLPCQFRRSHPQQHVGHHDSPSLQHRHPPSRHCLSVLDSLPASSLLALSTRQHRRR